MKYALIDPRHPAPAPAGEEPNPNDLLIRGHDGPIWGVEVTLPGWHPSLEVNIDPQHTGKDASVAAIELAVDGDLPPDNTLIVTVRPDLDAIGTMAVWALRKAGREVNKPGVQAIAEADKFARGAWQAQALPKPGEPLGPLAVVGAMVADRSFSLEEKVLHLAEWLCGNPQEPDLPLAFEGFKDQARQEQDGLAAALANGELTVKTQDGIACVYGNHRAATRAGYAVAPVVVATNPEFSFAGGPAHRKHTVCQYASRHADLAGLLAELRSLEPGWGGQPEHHRVPPRGRKRPEPRLHCGRGRQVPALEEKGRTILHRIVRPLQPKRTGCRTSSPIRETFGNPPLSHSSPERQLPPHTPFTAHTSHAASKIAPPFPLQG